MKSVLKWVIWLYIAAACAYVLYEWYATQGSIGWPPSGNWSTTAPTG
jgi:hypothetical protein